MNNLAVFFEITNICNHRCVHCCKYWEDNSVSRTADKDMLDKITLEDLTREIQSTDEEIFISISFMEVDVDE